MAVPFSGDIGLSRDQLTSVNARKDEILGTSDRFGPAVRPSGRRIPVREPTPLEIAQLLARLTTWLKNDRTLTLNPGLLQGIADSREPWEVLRSNMVRQPASRITFDQLKELVLDMHEEVFYLRSERDPYRLEHGTRQASGDSDTPEDAFSYATAYKRLTEREGLTSTQAHAMLKSWGFKNPIITEQMGTVPFDVQQLAEVVAVARVTGDYTGPVLPEQVVLEANIDDAFQLLSVDFSGALSFKDFTEFAVTQVGLGDKDAADIQSALAAGEQAASDAPDFDIREQETRIPVGFTDPGFVARQAPHPPGKLRGGRTQPGFGQEDADFISASGPRGEQLARPGEPGKTQAPEYFENANIDIWNGLSFEQKVLYQTMLVDAGWMMEDDFLVEQGVPGRSSWEAMAQAMQLSNASTEYTSWIEAAKAAAVAKDKAEAESGNTEPVPVYTPGIYLRPDPDYLKQVVKKAFRTDLGREPTANEVQDLIASLEAEYRSQYQVLETQARTQFEQNLAAQEASLGPIDPTTGERVVEPLGEGEGDYRTVNPSVSELTGVDPLASFAEKFEAQFSNELARNRYREVASDARGDIMASIFATDAAIGGGR